MSINPLTIMINFFLRLLSGLTLMSAFTYTSLAQPKNPALDSMGATMGRQNWKAAIHWALKAAEADPTEKYWRYLNAADFASRDKNADLALHYAAVVVDSDIATNAYFGRSFDWLRDDSRWKPLMDKVALAREHSGQSAFSPLSAGINASGR